MRTSVQKQNGFFIFSEGQLDDFIELKALSDSSIFLKQCVKFNNTAKTETCSNIL